VLNAAAEFDLMSAVPFTAFAFVIASVTACEEKDK
jgi:hypothetical protein